MIDKITIPALGITTLDNLDVVIKRVLLEMGIATKAAIAHTPCVRRLTRKRARTLIERQFEQKYGNH